MADGTKFFDDLARVAQGALGAANSARTEAEASFRAWFERQVAEMDFVPREDFDAVAEMARLAREENEALSRRIEALEQAMGERQAGRKAPADTKAASDSDAANR